MLILNHHLFDKFLDLGNFRVMLVNLLLDLIFILIVKVYQILRDEQLVIQLVVHLVLSKGNREA